MRVKALFPKLNVPKLKRLVDLEKTPIYKLAQNMEISQTTLERMLLGKRVGPKLLFKVAKYFLLNISDLIIIEDKLRDKPGQEETDIVYLDKITSFSNLYKNPDYSDSRFFSFSKNLLSHKIYNWNIKTEDEISRIKNFLIAFTDKEAVSIGTSKTSNPRDVMDEINYLRKQNSLDEPINQLEEINIGVYYGHYFYRAMEILSYVDTNDIDSISKEATTYKYIRPTGRRIEVIYFYKKKEYPGLPETITISPNTGYTEDELAKSYFKAFDYVHQKTSLENNNILADWIGYHNTRQWLYVRDVPELPEYVNNPEYGFLHPNYFIHTSNKTMPIGLLSNVEKHKKDVDNVLEEEKRFDEVVEKFRFTTSRSVSIPKFDGTVKEENTISKNFESLNNSDQQVIEKEDD